jgi:protein required for attachment to host cells
MKCSIEEVYMFDVLVRRGDWVVVCDGKKALVLENVGDTKVVRLKTREVHEQPDAKTSEQGTDKPGRSINSIDARRSAMEQTDWHDQEEERFLQRLASRLDAEVNAGNAKSVIIVAPPRALGVLRQAYSQNLRNVLRAEIDKDFVKMPIDEIEKRLAA